MTTENDKDPYRDCCLYEKGVCGAFKYNRNFYEGLEQLSNLEHNSVIDYLKNKLHLYIQDHALFSQINEKLLIENRVRHPLLSTDTICPHHRFKNGLSYKPSIQCAHLLHKKTGTGKKAAVTTRISFSLVMEANKKYPFSCVIGSRMCRTHCAKLSKDIANQELTVDFLIDEHSKHDKVDEIYEPDVIFPDEADDVNFIIVNDLSSTFSVSPVKYRVTRPINEVDERSIRYIKRKKDEFLEAAGSFFDKAIIPKQEIDGQSSNQYTFTVEMQQFVEAYQNSDSFGKMVILKLMDHNKYSKTDLMDIFKCSKRKIDQARSMKMQENSVKSFMKTKFKRNRMNTEKSEHFLKWLTSSGLLQDVAFGTKELKFDSGEKQSVPNTILQSKYSHTIQFYLDVCKEISYDPLSPSSLWKLLKGINPSQRKSLSGLDDVTAEAMNGFQFLQSFVEQSDKSVFQDLERAKRYLKLNYQGHCNNSSKIATHNTTYALSNAREEPCVGISDEVCSECFNVIKVLSWIEDTATKSDNEDLIYDVNLSVKKIIEYMKHQIRDEQQKQAKIYASEQISETTAFWLRDYSQKILPRSYREGQKSYFGKKGMSMHIDIFYTKPDGNLVKQVYYTLLYRCDQSKKETMNITDHVLKQFAQDYPRVSAINAKSDNASAYHGNHILENLFFLCKSNGLKLLRYDYNEPCRGKDQCDRESSGAKSLINSYVECGNDLLNITDLFNALQYGKGVSNAKVSVLEIDSSESVLDGQEITGINSYHSIKFFDDHMKLYRYFEIGSGKIIKYGQTGFTPCYSVKNDFVDTCNSSQKKKKQSAKKLMHFCTNPSCTSVFENALQLEKHLLYGVHVLIEERSSMDRFKSSFAKKMKTSLLSHFVTSNTNVELHENDSKTAVKDAHLFSEFYKQGWAIPKINYFRYSFDQKKFLYDIFMEGQRTGKKKSPEEVGVIMRRHFKSSKDYVTKSQIRSLFSNFARLLNNGTLTEPINDIEDKVVHSKAGEMTIFPDHNEDETNNVIEEIISDVATWDVGSWVVVRYNRKWLPGRIVPAEDIHHLEEDNFLVDCMGRKNPGANRFRWPKSRDLCLFERVDMLLEINEPSPVAETQQLCSGDIVWCALSDKDFYDADNALRKVLREDTIDD